MLRVKLDATTETVRPKPDTTTGFQHADDSFDVIVVGSGASGGWAAKRLSEAGIKVALLEAGKPQGDADFTEHVPAYDLTYRDRRASCMRRTRPRQRNCYACREWNYKWFANDLEEPYTTPDDKPFSWQGRTRVVGGRTNVWGRQCYRLSEQDLQGQVVRRLRRGLADLATRISFRTTSWSRTTSAFRDKPRTCPSCPTAASIRRCR